MTINENWDSVEDNDQADDDSEDDDSDTDGSESESDSRISSGSPSRSRSPSRESIKSISRSGSRSPSPSNSRSDSGSQDSDSDSSVWSDSSSSGSDDEQKKEDEDGDSSPMNKPLPRRKPQLTAPKLTLSDGSFRGAGRNDEFSSGKPNVADSKAPGSPGQKGDSAQMYKPSHTFTSPSAACIAALGLGLIRLPKLLY